LFDVEGEKPVLKGSKGSHVFDLKTMISALMEFCLRKGKVLNNVMVVWDLGFF
jgi:hypothetical protein